MRAALALAAGLASASCSNHLPYHPDDDELPGLYCDAVAYFYPIDIERDVTTPYANASQLRFTSCVTYGAVPGNGGPFPEPCETVQPGASSGSTDFSQTDVVVSKLANGNTHFKATVLLSDVIGPEFPSAMAPWPATTVSLHVADAKANTVLDLTGEITWEDKWCHPHPLQSSL